MCSSNAFKCHVKPLQFPLARLHYQPSPFRTKCSLAPCCWRGWVPVPRIQSLAEEGKADSKNDKKESRNEVELFAFDLPWFQQVVYVSSLNSWVGHSKLVSLSLWVCDLYWVLVSHGFLPWAQHSGTALEPPCQFKFITMIFGEPWRSIGHS